MKSLYLLFFLFSFSACPMAEETSDMPEDTPKSLCLETYDETTCRQKGCSYFSLQRLVYDPNGTDTSRTNGKKGSCVKEGRTGICSNEIGNQHNTISIYFREQSNRSYEFLRFGSWPGPFSKDSDWQSCSEGFTTTPPDGCSVCNETPY